MNNKLFISRCEIILATMKGGGINTTTTKHIAQWLNMEEASASQVISRACKCNILQKVGAAAKTCYKISPDCHNALESRCNSSTDMPGAIQYTVDWFVNHQTKRSVKKVIANGKEYTKIESQEELDAVSKQAVDNILVIIERNKEYKAEIELLREEIERLKPYEEYYKKVTSVKV